MQTRYLVNGRQRYDNEDGRRLLESPTPEEEAEILRSDTRQLNSITEAVDKLITATATASDNAIEVDREIFSQVNIIKFCKSLVHYNILYNIVTFLHHKIYYSQNF